VLAPTWKLCRPYTINTLVHNGKPVAVCRARGTAGRGGKLFSKSTNKKNKAQSSSLHRALGLVSVAFSRADNERVLAIAEALTRQDRQQPGLPRGEVSVGGSSGSGRADGGALAEPHRRRPWGLRRARPVVRRACSRSGGGRSAGAGEAAANLATSCGGALTCELRFNYFPFLCSARLAGV
jgi:hypothetical protein